MNWPPCEKPSALMAGAVLRMGSLASWAQTVSRWVVRLPRKEAWRSVVDESARWIVWM